MTTAANTAKTGADREVTTLILIRNRSEIVCPAQCGRPEKPAALSPRASAAGLCVNVASVGRR